MDHEYGINRISPLELAMRDVMDGMEEFVLDFAFQSVPDCFEILAIEPAEPPRAEVIPLHEPRRHAVA